MRLQRATHVPAPTMMLECTPLCGCAVACRHRKSASASSSRAVLPRLVSRGIVMRSTAFSNRAAYAVHVGTSTDFYAIQENEMANNNNQSNRGFAGMDEDKQREIAAQGGRAAHESGNAHEFSSEEAREAGRKGGEAVSQHREHMSEIGQKGGQQRQEGGGNQGANQGNQQGGRQQR